MKPDTSLYIISVSIILLALLTPLTAVYLAHENEKSNTLEDTEWIDMLNTVDLDIYTDTDHIHLVHAWYVTHDGDSYRNEVKDVCSVSNDTLKIEHVSKTLNYDVYKNNSKTVKVLNSTDYLTTTTYLSLSLITHVTVTSLVTVYPPTS